MKKPFFAASIISTLFAGNALAQEQLAPYQYQAGQAVVAPVIDGVLNDAVWQSAKTTKSFVFHNDNSEAPVVTWAKVAYDQNNLYVAFFAQDEDVTANFTTQDSPTYMTDDTVEIFIDPDGDGLNYYEIGVSAKTYYDVVIHTPSPWSDDIAYDIEGFEQAVNVSGTLNDNSDTDNGFSAEIKIPLKSLNYLGEPEGTDVQNWKFNLHRAEYSTGAADWEANGWLAWSPNGSFGFHQPDTFATLTFTGEDLWESGKAYRKGETVQFQGLTYVADYYSANGAPGQSSLDGWTVVSEEVTDYNENLIYTAGQQVNYQGQVWVANWKTKGQAPDQAQDWSLLY